GDLAPHLHAQLGIEVGERLVEEEHRRLADDRPAEGDALLLAARELPRPMLEQRLDAQDPGGFPDARGDLGAGDAPQLETHRQVQIRDGDAGAARVLVYFADAAECYARHEER